MRVFRHQDFFLIAAFAAAVVVIFSSSIQKMLDYVRGVEQETGLTLLPALVLLIGGLLSHQIRKRQQQQAKAEAAELAASDALQRAEELERLVAFGQALGRALDDDSIRMAIAQHLPVLAGTSRVWVLVQERGDWCALHGDAHRMSGMEPWSDLAKRLLDAGPDRTPTSLVDCELGFPLAVGGHTVGVLGIRPENGWMFADRRHILETAAALLAVSVKNAQLFRDVRDHSMKDALTGCVNRAHALEIINAELRRARRSQMPVTMIMFDLDHFDDLNDRHGQPCGDAALSTVGTRMKEVLRGSDLKCRWADDQFLVLLPETPLHGARRVADALRREIADRPMPWAGDEVTVTASFGLAQTLPGEVNVTAVIARAEAALERAKSDGRNCVRIAPQAVSLVAENRVG